MLLEEKYKQIYNPKSNRLQNYDYASNGGYFITICTKNRENYFGEIVDGKMVLNEIGKIVNNQLLDLKNNFENIFLDEFTVMPNHLHLILIINKTVETPIYRVLDDINGDTINGCLYNKGGNLIKDKNIMLNKQNIGFIIRKLKGKITYLINKSQNKIFFSWQPNYYDRIIRNENELEKIRKYILENPLKRELDKNNTENIFM